MRPFCGPDPHAEGDPPTYTVTTLQLDSPDRACHRAKESEALNRFKLRVRTYGTNGHSPVFMEVKQKIRGVVLKKRARVPADRWGRDLVYGLRVAIAFDTDEDYEGFLTFVRLAREIQARPVVRVRYVRESYYGLCDRYTRVTFDRQLRYQPARTWDVLGHDDDWIALDTPLVQNKGHPFSGVILELKTLGDAPEWIVDLTHEFGLARAGNCKYSTAVWYDSLFSSRPVSGPIYAADLLSF
jgi:hypothetical protein